MSIYYSKYARRKWNASDIIFWGIVGILIGTFLTCTLIIIGAMLFYG